MALLERWSNTARVWINGAAQESNLPSDGLRRLTGFEVRQGL
jgi:hypothetical protein